MARDHLDPGRRAERRQRYNHRPAVHSPMFKDATLLVTGGTGTFGHAVVDRVLTSAIREIRIFSRDEKKQDDMRRKIRQREIEILHRRRAQRRRPARRHARRGLCLSCRGIEAGAELRVLSGRGAADQCAGRRKCPERGDRRQRQAGRRAQHRQGRLSDQRHGDLEGDDGEDRRRQEPRRLATRRLSASRDMATSWPVAAR